MLKHCSQIEDQICLLMAEWRLRERFSVTFHYRIHKLSSSLDRIKHWIIFYYLLSDIFMRSQTDFAKMKEKSNIRERRFWTWKCRFYLVQLLMTGEEYFLKACGMFCWAKSEQNFTLDKSHWVKNVGVFLPNTLGPFSMCYPGGWMGHSFPLYY